MSDRHAAGPLETEIAGLGGTDVIEGSWSIDDADVLYAIVRKYDQREAALVAYIEQANVCENGDTTKGTDCITFIPSRHARWCDGCEKKAAALALVRSATGEEKS